MPEHKTDCRVRTAQPALAFVPLFAPERKEAFGRNDGGREQREHGKKRHGERECAKRHAGREGRRATKREREREGEGEKDREEEGEKKRE